MSSKIDVNVGRMLTLICHGMCTGMMCECQLVPDYCKNVFLHIQGCVQIIYRYKSVSKIVSGCRTASRWIQTAIAVLKHLMICVSESGHLQVHLDVPGCIALERDYTCLIVAIEYQKDRKFRYCL